MERERAVQRGRRFREPQEQPVAQLLHDAGRVGEHGPHEAVLRRQELQRLGVAAGGRELGEPDEVGEHDGALDHVGSGRGGAAITP